ncbi:nucleotidyltransferase family protein [Agrobacterium rhizogenes]|nr:nucleotidyltransferase family protein [Rhizobium rhizogenes]
MSEDEATYNWRVFKKILLTLAGKEPLSKKDIFNSRFSLGQLSETANKHRVMPQIATAFLESHVPGTDLYCSYFLGEQQFHRLRQTILVQEIERLSNILDQHKVVYAVRKGVTIDHYGYSGKNVRYFNDIDIAISPSDAGKVKEIIARNTSYIPDSYFNFVAQEIQVLPRETLVMLKIYPDHIPQYTRMSDSPIQVPLQLDIAFSLSWVTSEYPIDIDHALSTRKLIAVKGSEFYSLSGIYCFIDAYMHLFREAYFKSTSLKSDRISKFLDVLLLWENSQGANFSESDRDLIESYNLVAPLKWVAFHVDNIFGTDMKRQVDLMFADPIYELPRNFFQIYQREDGTVQEWKGDMDWRLMIDDKAKIYT